MHNVNFWETHFEVPKHGMATAFTQATQKDDGKGLDIAFNLRN